MEEESVIHRFYKLLIFLQRSFLQKKYLYCSGKIVILLKKQKGIFYDSHENVFMISSTHVHLEKKLMEKFPF